MRPTGAGLSEVVLVRRRAGHREEKGQGCEKREHLREGFQFFEA
jgi:hypothetical protein